MRGSGAQHSEHAGVERTLVDDDVARAPVSIEGSRLGRYIVGGRLGAGAMGVVYSAFDPELDRRVALKLLHPRLVGGTDEEAARLLREARAMARLSHPNVITVHDVGTHEGRIFLAMDEVDGETLTRWLQSPRSTAAIVDALIRAGRGLAAAHDRGLVHGDFKPDNVMIGVDGRVLVTDFGLARADADLDHDAAGGATDAAPDQTGLVGTPAYMAPEQFTGAPADAASDQFAFCVSMYEALYGQRPFAGATPGAIFVAMSEGDVAEPPGDRNVPRWLRRAVLRGLSRERERRHPDMHGLLRVVAGGGGHRRSLWAAGLFGVAGVAIAARVAGSGGAPCQESAAHLDGVWDAPRVAAVTDAIVATKSSYATETAQRVAERLDRYASEWVTMRHDNCVAIAAAGSDSGVVGDLRNACLDRRLRALQHVVSVLESADEGVVRNAVTAVAGLPPLSGCADVESLQSGLPPARDPEAVERLRERLDQVRGLRIAGHAMSRIGATLHGLRRFVTL